MEIKDPKNLNTVKVEDNSCGENDVTKVTRYENTETNEFQSDEHTSIKTNDDDEYNERDDESQKCLSFNSSLHSIYFIHSINSIL